MGRRFPNRLVPTSGNPPKGITILLKMTIPDLTSQLTKSLRRPTRRTLTLINKALHYLTPFESAAARTASASERHDLLDMVTTHRLILSPYIDLDRIENNLRHA